MNLRRMLGFILPVFATFVVGMASPAFGGIPSKNVPICVDDFCVVVPVATNIYVVKAADFNNDGKIDLYVTGDATRRFVSDFLLLQGAPDSYSIVATPTPAQVVLARTAPLSPITVSRMELNADRYYDFYFRNVDEVISGASDIIVTLTRGTGAAPSHVTAVNEEIRSLIEMFTSVLFDPESFMLAMPASLCPQVPHGMIMSIAWSNIFFPNSTYAPPDSWAPYFNMFAPYTNPHVVVSQNPAFQVSLAPLLQAGSCKSVQNAIPPLVKDLVFNLVETRSDNTIGPNDPREIWMPVWCQNVYGRYGRSCPPMILESSGVVIGGVIVTAAVVLAVLYKTGQISNDDVADLLDAIVSSVNSVATFPMTLPLPSNATAQNAADVGDDTNTAPLTGVDKYAFQNNCDHGPNNAYPNGGVSSPGDSDELGDRLAARGCGCPDGSDAHHILPKADGPTFDPVLKAKIRNCLNNAGIDIDHPANGVCLPQKKDPNSKAVVHGSANQKTYWNSVADLCKDIYDAEGPQGVRDMLDQAREHLINGNKWWKPGFDPFWPE